MNASEQLDWFLANTKDARERMIWTLPNGRELVLRLVSYEKSGKLLGIEVKLVSPDEGAGVRLINPSV